MRPSAEYGVEVRTERDQLFMGPASKRQMSRRHSKLTKRQAQPESPRQPNHQPQWQEATSGPAWVQEEQKAEPHVPWLMGNVGGMTVPTFSFA